MADQKPTPGRIVQYILSQHDVDQIHLTHGNPPRGMNAPKVGDVAPAMVVRVWSEELVNLQVFLDGAAAHWATSRALDPDEGMGTWHWPARS